MNAQLNEIEVKKRLTNIFDCFYFLNKGTSIKKSIDFIIDKKENGRKSLNSLFFKLNQFLPREHIPIFIHDEGQSIDLNRNLCTSSPIKICRYTQVKYSCCL